MNEKPLHVKQAEGLRILADLVEQNPKIGQVFGMRIEYFSLFLGEHSNPKEILSLVEEKAALMGASVSRMVIGDFVDVTAYWGPLKLSVTADRPDIEPARQTGTRTRVVQEFVQVSKEVPVYEYGDVA